MRRRRGPAVVVGALTAALVSGCVQVGSWADETVACAQGDDGTPTNGVVLLAQSVPSAEVVPCVESIPVGWHFAGLDARNGSARFWLDSDRHGARAIEVVLTGDCDTTGATEIASDRPELRRLERVTQISPQFTGRRYYLFDGGCITVVFRLTGSDSAEPLAVATQSLGVVSREDLRDLVREESGGRLELDPGTGA